MWHRAGDDCRSNAEFDPGPLLPVRASRAANLPNRRLLETPARRPRLTRDTERQTGYLSRGSPSRHNPQPRGALRWLLFLMVISIFWKRRSPSPISRPCSKTARRRSPRFGSITPAEKFASTPRVAGSKARTLKEGARVALAILDPENPYRYIQVRGTVKKRHGEGRRRAYRFARQEIPRQGQVPVFAAR